MKAFDSTAIAVIKAFQKGDSAAINRFVHRKTGLYFIERPGALNAISHDNNIEHGYGGYMRWEAHKGIRFDSLRYGSLPDYNCGTEKWNKRGAYADTISTDTLLSSTAIICNTFQGLGHYTKQQIASFRELEKNSCKVIVTSKLIPSLMFSLTWMENRWWLTIIDCVGDDCSA